MRHFLFLLALGLAALAAAVRPAWTPDRDSAGPGFALADAESRLQAMIPGRLARSGASGASIALHRDGEAVNLVYGRTAAFQGEPVTPHTVFEGASLSKPVTAWAVLQLAQQGRLDLDAPVERRGQTFTLRQVLSHSAGFDNSLATPPAPSGAPGDFAYAGTGYLFLGEAIEGATGQSFADHMNNAVLPQLGMTDSRFGADAALSERLARPHLDPGLPIFLFGAAALLVGAPAFLLAFITHHLGRRFGWRTGYWPWRIALGVGVFAGAALVGLFFGGALRWSALGAAGGVFILALLSALAASGQGLAGRLAGLGGALLIALILFLRPAIPMEERPAHALPAAGLVTTPSDYALFMREVISPTRLDPDYAALLTMSAVPVNTDQAWSLGLGVQQSGEPLVWHWGVNFPGYQAFAAANPETGEIFVMMINGGAMSFSPGGYRYAGLEIARDAARGFFGGEHSAYWQGVP